MSGSRLPVAPVNATGPADFQRMIVLDFEATCQEGKETIQPQEIIEFPIIVLDVATGEEVARFHEFVRPVGIPTLTHFCTQLTSITQDTVDSAEPFHLVFQRVKHFLFSHGLNDDNTVVVTCGDWDLKSMLPRQIQFTSSTVQDPVRVPALFKRWINAKVAFGSFYNTRIRHLSQMNELLGMQFEGRQHLGIDDTHNLARTMRRMIQDGWNPTHSQLIYPMKAK